MENSTPRNAQLYCDTYFGVLPEELLLEILRYVSISDLWNFCDAFKDIEHFLKEKALTRNINLKGWYDVNTSRILLNINPESVTFLNVNYCHWLPHEGLLSFVGKCANLETLLAFGTKLELSDQDMESYHKTKINKLAVTIKNQTVSRTVILDRVTSLALEIDCDMFEVCPAEDFNRIFPSLQKVGVDCISNKYFIGWMCQWLQGYKSPLQLQGLIIKFNGYYPMILVKNFLYAEIPSASNLHLTSLGVQDNEKLVACYENVKNCRFDKAYGRKVAKLLHSGEKTLETIQFEELDFSQQHTSNSNKKASQQLLMSRNARNIEKLTLCICLLNDYKDDNNPEKETCNLKKFNNLRFLRLCSNQALNLRDLSRYNSLANANLTKLRYLFVEIPKNCDGNFLNDVLNKCPQLETLRIDNVYNFGNNLDVDNFMINHHIGDALEHSANLKELLLENFVCLCIDNLLSQLITSNKMKLQRLLFSCKYTDRLIQKLDADEFRRVQQDQLQSANPHLEFVSLDLLSKYMDSNPQLTDCLIYIEKLKDENIEFIKQQVNTFNKASYRHFDIGRGGQTFKNCTLSRFNLMDDIGTF